MWSALSIHVRRGVFAGKRRRRPFADIARDELVLECDLKDGRERSERLVDARHAQRAQQTPIAITKGHPGGGGRPSAPRLLDFRAAIAVDVLDRDRVDALGRKRRKQVRAQPPLEVSRSGGREACARAAALELLRGKPLTGELMERWRLARGRRGRRGVWRWLPGPAPNVSEDILQFLLCACAVPSVAGVAEVDELPRAERAEAERVRGPARG